MSEEFRIYRDAAGIYHQVPIESDEPETPPVEKPVTTKISDLKKKLPVK